MESDFSKECCRVLRHFLGLFFVRDSKRRRCWCALRSEEERKRGSARECDEEKGGKRLNSCRDFEKQTKVSSAFSTNETLEEGKSKGDWKHRFFFLCPRLVLRVHCLFGSDHHG